MVNTLVEGEIDRFLSEERAAGSRNIRNGKTSKRDLSEVGSLDISIPRDRHEDFESERELNNGLDEQILALYAQGNSVEDVRRLVEDIYGVSISVGQISQITNKILPQIQEWRTKSP